MEDDAIYPSSNDVLGQRLIQSSRERIKRLQDPADPESKEMRGYVTAVDPMLADMINAFIPEDDHFTRHYGVVRLVWVTRYYFPGNGYDDSYEQFAEDLFSPVVAVGGVTDDLYCTLSRGLAAESNDTLVQAFKRLYSMLATEGLALPFESLVRSEGVIDFLDGPLHDHEFFRDLTQLTFYGVNREREFQILSGIMRGKYVRPPHLHLKKRLDVSKTDLRAYFDDSDLLRNIVTFICAALLYPQDMTTGRQVRTEWASPVKGKNLLRTWGTTVNSLINPQVIQGDISSFTANCRNSWVCLYWILMVLEHCSQFAYLNERRVVFVEGKPFDCRPSHVVRYYLYLTWEAPFISTLFDTPQYLEGGYLGIAMNMALTSSYFSSLLIRLRRDLLATCLSVQIRVGGDDFIILLMSNTAPPPWVLATITMYAGRLKDPRVTILGHDQGFLPLPFCQKHVYYECKYNGYSTSAYLSSDTKLPEMGHHFCEKITVDVEKEYLSYIGAVDTTLEHNRQAHQYFRPLYEALFVRMQRPLAEIVRSRFEPRFDVDPAYIGEERVSPGVLDKTIKVGRVLFGDGESVLDRIEDKFLYLKKTGLLQRVDYMTVDGPQYWYILPKERSTYFSTHFDFIPPPRDTENDWVDQMSVELTKLRSVVMTYRSK